MSFFKVSHNCLNSVVKVVCFLKLKSELNKTAPAQIIVVTDAQQHRCTVLCCVCVMCRMSAITSCTAQGSSHWRWGEILPQTLQPPTYAPDCLQVTHFFTKLTQQKGSNGCIVVVVLDVHVDDMDSLTGPSALVVHNYMIVGR